MKNRLIGIGATIGLLLSGLVAAPAAATNCELSGNGTSADPYLIASDGDFSAYGAVCDAPGVHVKLTANLSGLNGGSYDLAGNLDGNGHVIFDFQRVNLQSGGAGLFGEVTGSIRNLLVHGAEILSIGQAGVLGARAVGATVEDVAVWDSLVVGFNNAGGLFGETEGQMSLKRNTIYDIDVQGGSSAGGLVGQFIAGSGSEVVTNHVIANVIASGQFSKYVGGLIGWLRPAGQPDLTDVDPEVLLRDNGFEGIVSIDRQAVDNPFAGGLVGEISPDTPTANGSEVLVENSFSKLTIRGSFGGSTPPAGLVAGLGANVSVDVVRAWTSVDVEDPDTLRGNYDVIATSGTSIADVYYSTDRSGDNYPSTATPGTVGKTTAQLRDFAQYPAGWNIDNSTDENAIADWLMHPTLNDGYPMPLSMVRDSVSGQVYLNNNHCELVGAGVEDDPYVISTRHEFVEAMSPDCSQTGVSVDFILGQDISLHGGSWKARPLIGTDRFSSFNGNGYRVSDLEITESVTGEYGLFSRIENADVFDLNLVSNGITCSADCAAGILAGSIVYSSVNRVLAELRGTIQSEASGIPDGTVGMLAGVIEGSSLSEIMLDTFISQSNGHPYVKGRIAGGLAGSFDGELLNLDIFAWVEASEAAGVVAGQLVLHEDKTHSQIWVNGFARADSVGALYGEIVSAPNTDPKVLTLRDVVSIAEVNQPDPSLLPATMSNLVEPDIALAFERLLDNTDFAYSGQNYLARASVPLQVGSTATEVNVVRDNYTAVSQLSDWRVYDSSANALTSVDPSSFTWTHLQAVSGPIVYSAQLWNSGALSLLAGVEYQALLSATMSTEGLSVVSDKHLLQPYNRPLYYLVSVSDGANFGVVTLLDRSDLKVDPSEAFFVGVTSGVSYDISILPVLSLFSQSRSTQTLISYTVPELCAPGTSSDSGYEPCVATNTAPAPYLGPIVSTLAGQQISAGSEIEIAGEGLDSVTEVRLGDSVLELVSASSGSIIAKLPEDVNLGEQDLILVSSFGELRIRGFASVSEAVAETSDTPVVSIKRIGDTVRVFAKDVVGGGKVQFKVNGREVAWIRAVDNSDPKLFFANDTYYLVRRIDLNEGKNIFEVYVEGERVRRVAYTR